MAFEELRAKKKELGYSNQYISERTGIPPGTIQKFFAGTTKAPRMETIRLIEHLLMIPEKQTSTEQEQKEASVFEQLKKLRKDALEGRLTLQAKEKEFDYSDCLLRAPEGRLEVIEGQLFEREKESYEHNLVVGEIMIQLDSFIERKKKRDLVIINPVDVFLNKDKRTVVHPDISLLQNKYMYEDGMIFGPPDFIIEVVTPESRKKDTITKYYRYALAGVKAFWTVDLNQHYVTVYNMKTGDQKLYTFKNKIPVDIWKDEFFVDFSKIEEKLAE